MIHEDVGAPLKSGKFNQNLQYNDRTSFLPARHAEHSDQTVHSIPHLSRNSLSRNILQVNAPLVCINCNGLGASSNV